MGQPARAAVAAKADALPLAARPRVV
jgi:hypothetical protein